MSYESVGTLLAVIANSLNDGLRILMFADKRAWGPDEFEQLRLLEETLDEAKKDFQELPSLVNGRGYYEHNQNPESLEDLRVLCTRFELHAQTFKDWLRMGGPINPMWARDTITLRRDLHMAQCRAVRRIFNSEQETATRCLGGFQVFRVQRSPDNAQQRSLEELVACNQTGRFQRFGERDIAFSCDFCDGFIVWEDLREMPSTRRAAHDGAGHPVGTGVRGAPGVAEADIAEPTSATSMAPAPMAGIPENWQAVGFRASDGTEQNVVFPAVAIANHMPPFPGEWQSHILCPFCEDYYTEEQGEDDMDRVKWNQDEGGYDDMNAFREHLEWSHGVTTTKNASSCCLM
ncbi:hypothetical protein BX600DRAFT_94763 [Xylariales sp. PMI_506]|nr:hypothetical protein BX600DRAFT_94763 [Xylariales sp. PMI_506]